jgi:predicted metalloprotease with PDZ domain
MKKKIFSLIIFLISINMVQDRSMAAVMVRISYKVSFPEAQAHYADVEMTVSGLNQNTLELKMPVWTPGSYLVREFAKNIELLTAEADGKAVKALKIRKNCWQIDTKGVNAVKVKYLVYAFEISVRTSFIDASHAFLANAGVFLYPEGMLDQPAMIHLMPYKIIPYKDWDKVSTSLEMVNNDPFTLYSPNFDILFDSPIEIGNQDVFGFNAAGVTYEVCMVGGGNYDKERLKKDMAAIVETETAVYGENPNKRYVFIVHNYQRGGGGLEHLASTVLGASRDAYGTERGYQNFLSLVAHEHFHLWNVKRLRPIVLGPFDYDNENYTTDLWIAEGFTAYYQDIILRHADLISTENYLNIVADGINTLQNIPGHTIQTLAESSYDAWIKAYRPNENSNNSTISYYNKGALVAMLLDLQIIKNSKGKHSLDDVMRYMYDTYYKAKKRGYTDAEFKLGFEKFAGENLDGFYANYIYGLTELDYDRYLDYAGYKLVNEWADTNEPSLGVATANINGKIIVTAVSRNSAAWVDGINVNDELVTIDGNPVKDMAAVLTGKQPGDKLVIAISRDGKPYTLPVLLLKRTQVRYHLESVANPTSDQLAVRKKWLKL